MGLGGGWVFWAAWHVAEPGRDGGVVALAGHPHEGLWSAQARAQRPPHATIREGEGQAFFSALWPAVGARFAASRLADNGP